MCGDALGPDALLVLAQLGQHTALRAEERVSSFTVADNSGNRVSGVPPVPGYVVPRQQFDKRMWDAATAAGAQFVQARITGLVQQPGNVRLECKDGTRIVADTVIGADGANSAVRRLVGAPPNTPTSMAVAVRGYAANTTDLDDLYICWDDTATATAYVWAFPTADGRVNVGYGTTVDGAAAGDGTRTGKAFLESRAHAMLNGIVDTADVPFTGHRLPEATFRPAPAYGRVLLAGDAASLINPLSGEGIFYALLSGSLAGQAAFAADPGAAYTADLYRRLGTHHRQVALMARVAGPFTVAAGLRASREDPAVFDALLKVVLGDGHMTTADTARFARAWVRSLWRK